ncbi:MAG TPA: outer-membrane lipoprotein carrier protein LolA [Terriglobales bacterium]
MKLSWLFAVVAFSALVASPASAQQSPLDQAVASMDRASDNFRSTEASFVWNQYTKVVDDMNTQKGKVYFRRTGNGVEMAANLTDPSPEQILFQNGKVQLYRPSIEQVTVYNAGQNRAAVESFLVLGFGGSGKDMMKTFDVSYLGSENVDGVSTTKLQLVPKSDRIRNTFDHIVLWIDPARGISIQQQFITPNGDYKLAKYSDIKLNGKISDDAFRLKTTSKTKFVSP